MYGTDPRLRCFYFGRKGGLALPYWNALPDRAVELSSFFNAPPDLIERKHGKNVIVHTGTV